MYYKILFVQQSLRVNFSVCKQTGLRPLGWQQMEVATTYTIQNNSGVALNRNALQGSLSPRYSSMSLDLS